MNKFCVMTTGRAGSTSFMEALAVHDDIAVPNKQVDCPDHEIFRIKNPEQYWEDYEALAGFPINDELSLIRAFYQSNDGARYAGYKSMPNRHRQLKQMLAEHDPRMICIFRRNVPATIASFIAALERGSWRRSGEAQAHTVCFTPALVPQVNAHINYLVKCMNLFARLPRAIVIAFEDLCDPDYANPALESYFERPVKLLSPRPPVDGSTYVENWPALVAHVEDRLRALRSGGSQ